MLTPHTVDCPYCGEPADILLDTSISSQRYIEDCQVCCRPITLDVNLDETGAPTVRAFGENDA